ncbi:MAG: RHS repeat-associated core domain-containing protein, partial [Armatimonadia bacterium]
FVSEGPSVYDALVAHRRESDPATEAWYLPDALGTTLGLTGGAGLLTDTFLYDAFGNALDRTGTTPTPYQYVGAYGYFTEPLPNLMLLWHRWYDAAAGRFVSRDPIGMRLWDDADSSVYVYGSQIPTGLTDATGTLPIAAIWDEFVAWTKDVGLVISGALAGLVLGEIWGEYLKHLAHECEKSAKAGMAAFDKAAERAWRYARPPYRNVRRCKDECFNIFAAHLKLRACIEGCESGGRDPRRKRL